MKTEKFILLESVGCGIDPETLITYPMFENNSYDLNGGVHLDDTCSEWRGALSIKDWNSILMIKEFTNL